MKKLFMIFGLFAVVLCFPVKSYAITRYIINNGKVYYQRLKYRDEMTEADTPTFKNLDYFYAKDKNNVYYEGHLLEKLDANKTTIIDAHENRDFNFFTDGNYVYKNEILVEAKRSKKNPRIIIPITNLPISIIRSGPLLYLVLVQSSL